MKPALRTRLDQMLDRHEELTALISDPEVMSDNKRYTALTREHYDVGQIVKAWQAYKQAENDIEAAKAMMNDPEFKELASEEMDSAQQRITQLQEELDVLMLPKDPNDNQPAFLEIRAGTGGDEAAIFSGDLYRMYSRYAEKMGWRMEVLSTNDGEHGGFKEIITRVEGQGVYGRLKFESGAHRVQRVPDTESQGRIHTSACTVAIMPDNEEEINIEINPADLRVDTYRASGAGGQHVNKTDSAIRITHLPSGIVVQCQDERSQHKNRSRAMSLLAAKLESAAVDAQQSANADMRRNLVGSGDRSERIRTYNYPQGRMTDHRINLTLYKLDAIMDGDLNELLDSLQKEHQIDLMAMLAAENGG